MARARRRQGPAAATAADAAAPGARVSGVAVSLAVFGVFNCLAFPWLFYPANGNQSSSSLGFFDLLDLDGVAYEQRLLIGPLVAYGAVMLVGVYRLVQGRAAGPPRSPAALGIVLVAAGFVLVLAASRWVGLYVARLLDAGPATLHPHAAIVLNIAEGIAFLALGWRTLRAASTGTGPAKPARLHLELSTLAIAGGTLVLVPLLPLAMMRTTEAQAFYYDEFTLAVLQAAADSRTYASAHHLSVVRSLFWAVLLVSILLLALEIRWGRGRTVRGLAFRQWGVLALLPLALGTAVYLLLFYRDLGRLGASAFPNPFPVAGTGLLLWVSGGAAWRRIARGRPGRPPRLED